MSTDILYNKISVGLMHWGEEPISYNSDLTPNFSQEFQDRVNEETKRFTALVEKDIEEMIDGAWAINFAQFGLPDPPINKPIYEVYVYADGQAAYAQILQILLHNVKHVKFHNFTYQGPIS